MKTPFRFGCVFLLVLTVAVADRACAADEQAAQWFKEAAGKMQARRFDEAVPLLEKVRAAAPDNPSVGWNLGLAYAELERHEDALGVWRQMQKLEPGNWQNTAKVVQALQALGRTEERDQAIAQVLAERKAAKDPQLARLPWFCREQFKVGDQKVMAIEYFEPKGPQAVYAAFHVSDATGKALFRYSLGSYDATTEIARSTGEVGPTGRIYHLDYYGTGASQLHRTHGFFKQRPDYAALRDMVVKAMKGDLAPLSSSERPSQAPEKK